MIYRNRRPSYGKQLYYVICIFAVGFGTLFSIWGPSGYLEMQRTKVQLEAHRTRVEALRRENAERYRRIQSLRSDPAAIEDLARQKGFGRDGEIVRRLPTPDANSGPAKR